MEQSYSENPAYYRQLIAQINGEANFPGYLNHLGYNLLKKSASSLEFDNGEDRIVLNVGRNPVTYFNRNDSMDKGLFFKFLRKNQPNFYKTIEIGLEIIDRTYEMDNNFLEVPKKEGNSKSLEENYNIVPLNKMAYLTDNREISKVSINDELFRGRIFNAFHVSDNGGKIANIAFPKYDLKGKPKNYILYNKEYFDRTENKRKKFRLVLNKRDHFMFYSKPIQNPKRVVFGESALDLLSYHELHGSPKNFYISFGGNVYPEKLSFFTQLIEAYTGNKKMQFTSIFDNDSAGREFDLKVFSALVNNVNPNVYVEHQSKHGKVKMVMHYVASHRDQIQKAKIKIENSCITHLNNKGLSLDSVKIVGFVDKLLLEINSITPTENGNNAFKMLLETLGKLYLPFSFGLHKSTGKDWNDDLRDSKQIKYVAMTKVVMKSFGIGDRVELKSESGPENTKNVGTIIAIKKKGVVCDFGLKYAYSIPYSAIKVHYQKAQHKSLKRRRTKQTKSNITLAIS